MTVFCLTCQFCGVNRPETLARRVVRGGGSQGLWRVTVGAALVVVFIGLIPLAGIFTRIKCFEKNGTSVSFELNRNVTYYWKMIRQSGPGSACHESSNPEPALFLPDLW